MQELADRHSDGSVLRGSNLIAFPSSDIRLFLTAYDPLDLASGSIDVLGLQGGYIAMANKFLPGFTTVTTSPRYVSMLCAAVAAAETAFPGADSAVRLRQERLTAVKSFERAWAIACGYTTTDPTIGDKAVDGLRGVQYIRRRMSELSGSEKSIRTRSVTLLANQVRYGGIGAYSTLLEDCHLASMRSITLRPLGAILAESFPMPGNNLEVWDEDKPLSIEGLREWGLNCHLGKFSRDEGRGLATALRGGEEREFEDDVRWASLRLLAAFGDNEADEATLLQQMLEGIRRGDFNKLNAPAACIRRIEATLLLIRSYEKLSQALLFLFDAVRAAATDEPEIHLHSVASKPNSMSACEEARNAATELIEAIEEAGTVDPGTSHDLRTTFVAAGIVALAESLRNKSEDVDLIHLVVNRHRDVQQGKFDRGERKAAWIRQETPSGPLRLTAQRHQLPRSGRYDSWDELPWHPYRTFGARRFVRSCGIQ